MIFHAFTFVSHLGDGSVNSPTTAAHLSANSEKPLNPVFFQTKAFTGKDGSFGNVQNLG